MNYATHHSRLLYFDTTSGRMAYRDEGDGPVVFLVHGVPTSSWIYSDIIDILIRSGLRVIAPDMLGFGASDCPEGYDIYNAANQGLRMRELIDHLGIDDWTHVFHDGGGLWTWEMLRQRPGGIRRLVSLNSIFYQSGFHPPLKFDKGWIADQFVKMYTSPFGQKLVLDGTFRNGLSKGANLPEARLLGYREPFLRKGGHRGLYYFFTQTCHNIPDYRDLHKSIDVPLCVIWGSKDKMLRWTDIAEEVRANFNIKEQHIHILDSNHFIQEEEPEFIAATISAFALGE